MARPQNLRPVMTYIYTRTNDKSPYTYDYVADRTGYFHCFAQEGDSDGECPVAIVELLDGTVKTFGIKCIKFLDV